MRALTAKESVSKRNSQYELQGFEFPLPLESEMTGTAGDWWHWLLSASCPSSASRGRRAALPGCLSSPPHSGGDFVRVVSSAPGNA